MIKKIYFSIGFFALLLGFTSNIFLRPYVYRHNLNDWGITGSISSFISVIAYCFIFWSFKNYTNKQMNIHIIIATFIFSLFWEVLGVLNLWGTPDIKDFFAGLLSGFFVFFVKNYIKKNIEKTNKINLYTF